MFYLLHYQNTFINFRFLLKYFLCGTSALRVLNFSRNFLYFKSIDLLILSIKNNYSAWALSQFLILLLFYFSNDFPLSVICIKCLYSSIRYGFFSNLFFVLFFRFDKFCYNFLLTIFTFFSLLALCLEE